MDIPNWVYLIEVIGGDKDQLLKLGFSQWPDKRKEQHKLDTGALSIRIYGVVRPIQSDGRHLEQYLKRLLKPYQVDGEWFQKRDEVIEIFFSFVCLNTHTGFLQLHTDGGRHHWYNGELIDITDAQNDTFF